MEEGKPIFVGEHMRATAYEVDGAKGLIALFDHRRCETGFPAVTRVPFASQNGFSQIKVTVARPDYFLNPDLPAARQSVAAYAGQFAEVSGMGFSMGGFGCMVFARALGLQKALLVSPQRPKFPFGPISGHMDAKAEAAFFEMGDDRTSGLPDHLKGVILFDPWFNDGRDRAYARILGDLVPGLCPVAMPGGGHPASSVLAQLKRFGQLQKAFLQSGMLPQTFKKMQRNSRLLDRPYLHRVLDRLENGPTTTRIDPTAVQQAA